MGLPIIMGVMRPTNYQPSNEGGVRMVSTERNQLINKLSVIGQNLMINETLPIRVVAQFVEACAEQFGLSDEDRKALLYLIVRMK